MPIDRPLRNDLIAALEALPGVEHFEERTMLLLDVEIDVTRSQTSRRTDLLGIVRDLERAAPRRLLTVLDNAIDRVGPGGAAPFQALRERVEAAISATGGATAPTPAPAPVPARTWAADDLRRLREALAEIFPTATQARIVCEDVALSLARVAMDGSAIDRWFEVLREAHNQGRLDALFARALEEAPGNPALRALRG